MSEIAGAQAATRSRLAASFKSRGTGLVLGTAQRRIMSHAMRRRDFFLNAAAGCDRARTCLERGHDGDPPYAGTNLSATPFMQYRRPVGCGPSLNTCPR